MSTAITRDMQNAALSNRAANSLWMRATGCPAPRISTIENVKDSRAEDNTIRLHHGYVVAQGPNYALAKTAQVWRTILAKNYPSFCNGPITKTASVCHNPTMAAMLQSFDRIKPYEVMDPPCASTMMGLLLMYDVLFQEDETNNGHPYERTLGGAFHGGDLRKPFNIESSKILSGALLGLGKYF